MKQVKAKKTRAAKATPDSTDSVSRKRFPAGETNSGMSATMRRRTVARLMAESSKMEVDNSLPINKRPLTGLDIEMWRQSMRLNIPKTSYALGIPTPNHYIKMANRRNPLPIGMEILLRLYTLDDTPPPWHAPAMVDIYEEYYGKWVKYMVDEHGPGVEKNARIRAYSRFAALFGRSPYTSYRWIDNAEDANTKPDVDRIAGKVWSMKHHGQAALEALAARVWSLRGMNFDLLFPLRLDDYQRSAPS